MAQKKIVRATSGVSAVALAAGLVIAAGFGTASAASGSLGWSDGRSSYTRTISNVTPSGGETIVVSTQFKRSYGAPGEQITMVRDQHPTCLTYVPNSAHIDEGGPLSNVTADADSVTLTGNPLTTATNPVLPPAYWPTFHISYKVGYDCGRGVALTTGMNYNGNQGAGSYPGKGPNITVGNTNMTATMLAVAPSAVQQGQPVSLSATVAGGADGDTVGFYEGANKIGEGHLAAGVATFNWTTLAEGQFSVTAKFQATSRATESVSDAQTVSVTPADVNTQTTLTAPATAVVGADITLSTTVTPATATGKVQFKDGGVNVGDPVDVVGGNASTTRTFDEAGSHSFTAHFAGTGLYLDSESNASTVNVKDADFGTATTVGEPVTATVGVPTNLSASVLPFPTSGRVRFIVDGVGIGSADVGTANGVATLPHTFNTVGTANVVAEFLGATGFTESTSQSFPVTVKEVEAERQATTTALAVSGESAIGKEMTFTATVAPGTAAGDVVFKSGNTVLGGPVTVVNGVATLKHTFTTVGTYAVTANFTGGAGFADSVSGPTVIGVIEAATPPAGGGSLDLGSLTSLFGS